MGEKKNKMKQGCKGQARKDKADGGRDEKEFVFMKEILINCTDQWQIDSN